MLEWVAARTARSGFFSCSHRLGAERELFQRHVLLPGCLSSPVRWGALASGPGCLSKWVCNMTADLTPHIRCVVWPVGAPRPSPQQNDLFPGPRLRLLRSGSEPTTEYEAASQIFLQIEPACLMRGVRTSDRGMPFARLKKALWMQQHHRNGSGEKLLQFTQRASHFWECLRQRHEKEWERKRPSGGTWERLAQFIRLVCAFWKKIDCWALYFPGEVCFCCTKRTKEVYFMLLR